TCNFGFVHQILSFERIHDGAITAGVRELGSYLLDRLSLLLTYGPSYLAPHEMEARFREMLDEYYAMLASALFNCRGREFWTYHHTRLKEEFGRAVYGMSFAKAVSLKLLDLLLNPKQAVEKAAARVRRNCIEPIVNSYNSGTSKGLQ